MMNTKDVSPISLKVDIDAEALKQVVEEGRLSDLVNAFPTLAAGYIKGELVEQLARGAGVSFEIGFDTDEEFGTVGPKPFPFIDTVSLPESRWGMRHIVRDELVRIGR